MKMADGGTRPALNVQFASDGDAQMIIAVDRWGGHEGFSESLCAY